MIWDLIYRMERQNINHLEKAHDDITRYIFEKDKGELSARGRDIQKRILSGGYNRLAKKMERYMRRHEALLKAYRKYIEDVKLDVMAANEQD